MDAIIKKITPFEDSGEWKGQCVTKIKEALEADPSARIFGNFVNRAGQILPNPLATPDLLAGINYKACVKYCGYDQLSTVFSFEIFSSGATNYLLPWLALTAQLPFETGENEVLANVMSFSYAVGSPMLITYSLATTILNQHWLRGKFHKLEASDRPLHLTSKNVRIFLQESQQLPLRISQEDGSLASLIVLSDNVQWWEKLKINILLTRRGVTLSLVAQILVAVLSWVLTIISALGNASEALALSSGSLWVWLVPIIYGWIVVGTQRQYGTIARALNRDMINILDSRPSNHSSRPIITQAFNLQPTSAVLIEERQKAFKAAPKQRLMQPLTRSPSEDGFFRLEPSSSDFDIPNCLGLSVSGDEKQEGPAFNYARSFTWWNMANRFYQALEETDDKLSRNLGLDIAEATRGSKVGQDNLKGDVLALSRYCGLADKNAMGPEQINEYPRWSQLDSEFYQRMVIAMVIAVYVQWGSTSAGIIIAYLTEVKGLGCRSGGYLVYGVVATVAFFCLFISSIFSHAAMLRHENLQVGGIRSIYGRVEQDPFDKQTIASSGSERREPRGSSIRSQKLTFGHNILRFCAVITRMLGRTLALFNALWIVLSTIWELVGFYDNCWCDSIYISKGAKGWVLLFVERSDLAHAAAAPWAGGVFLSIFVGATSCGVFWLYCRGNRT